MSVYGNTSLCHRLLQNQCFCRSREVHFVILGENQLINHETTGLAAERLENIRNILKSHGIVRVDDLCDELGVSPATIRRDLAELDLRGQLRRVHGGAVSIAGNLDEPMFDAKAAIAAREKQKIAESAISLIKPKDSIFLDAGTTILSLAKLLTNMTQLTVVTNSLRVANSLSGKGPRMLFVGGEFRRLSQSFVGPLTSPIIDQLSVDTAFMGTTGFCVEKGLTTTDPGEAHTKRLIMAHARQIVLLVDSSKINQVSFAKFGMPSDVDIIITDKDIHKNDLDSLSQLNIRVITT
jgi:DeoR/GlpR family transcriptional regulator of sugar metabolism